MKKKLQFLLSAVMLLCVALGAKAQPVFSPLVDDGETIFYLYNVEAEAYLLGANDWGTRASLSKDQGYGVKVKKNGDTWDIQDYVPSKSKWYPIDCQNTGSIWVDGTDNNGYRPGAGKWVITSLGDNKYQISNTNVTSGVLSANATLEDSKVYISESLPAKTWAFVKADICAFMDGWSINNGSTFHVNTWSGEGNSDGSEMKTPFLENWVSSGNVLPEGTWSYTFKGLDPYYGYEVSALIRAYNEGSSVDPQGAYLYAGKGKSDDISTGTTFTYNGNAGVYGTFSTIGYADKEGNLTVGIVEKDNNFNWIAMRDLTIEPTGVSLLGEINAKADAVSAAWSPANTKINKKDKDYPTYVLGYEFGSSVLGKISIADAMYKANQMVVEAKDDAEKALINDELDAATPAIETQIANAQTLIDEALAAAEIAYKDAKDASDVSKALPAGGYYLMSAGATYLGYAGGDRGSKVAHAAHPVEWIFAAVDNYGAYTFESAVADGDKYYFDGSVADGEKTTIYISKAEGYDAANPTFVLALGKGEKYLKPDFTTGEKADAAVWTIKSTDPKAIKAAGDVTYLIKDANFDSNRNQAAWSFNNDKGEGGNDGNLRGGKKDNFCAETYKSAFTLHQKLTGIPNGYYTLKAKGATSKEFGPFFTANSERFFFAVKGDEGNLDAMSDAFAAGNYEGKVEVQVTDNTLEIGAQNTDKSLWVIFDDFSLYYNGDNSTAYNLQVGDSVYEAWKRLDAKYNAIKDEGDPLFDVDAQGQSGAISGKIGLIKSNTTQKEIEVIKKVDGQDKKVKVMVDTGHGIDQLMPVVGTPGTSYAEGTGTAYSDKSFIVKPTEGDAATVADSLYAKMDGIYTLLDNYQENAAARDELNNAIADLKEFWQTVYDLGNVYYGDVAKNYPDDAEFAEQVAEFRDEFEANLLDLNDIDLNIAAIADQVTEYFFSGTVMNKKDEIKQALAEQKTNIEDELVEIQAESKAAVDAAAAEKIAIYDAAITVINQHYADKHKEIAKETNDNLFTIHEQIVKIQTRYNQEYNEDVVKANNDKIAANVLPTAVFAYATYLEDLEKVETKQIEKFLGEADAAALLENNDLVKDYTYGFYNEKGQFIGDGYNQLVKKFSDAIGRDAVYSYDELKEMKENKDGLYDNRVQTIATNLVALSDTLDWYNTEAHTKQIGKEKTEKVYATFDAPTGITWNAENMEFSWSSQYGNQLKNIGLPNGDITNYEKVVIDCTIEEGDGFRFFLYATTKGNTASPDANGPACRITESGKHEFKLADLAVDPDYLTKCSEFCLSGYNPSGKVKVNYVYFETFEDPTASMKDTIICIYDAVPFLDALIADNQAAIDELAEIVENSDAIKAKLADELSELRATWNQAKVGIIPVDPEVAAENGLQESYDAINAIDLTLTAPDYYYDDEMYNERHAFIESEKLRLSNYDEWVENYILDGDLNVDGDVTVTDVLIGIQYNLGNAAPKSKQEKYAAYAEDWKKADAKVDAVRLMEILNTALGETYEEDEEEVAAKARVKAEDLGQDYLVKDGAKMNLVNATQFYMFEMDVTVADGSTLEATLGERASKLNLYTSDLGNGKYHLLAMSLKKAAIADNEGTLFELNNENVIFSDITFVDGKAKGYVLDVVNASDIETGEVDAIADIKTAIADGKAAIYTANGAQVANLQKGVNIVKFTNGSVRKIFVK